MHRWGAHARQRARAAGPDRAGLAVGLPLRQATAVIESITAHDELVSVRLYGHPWVTGEYWPMIAPCFQVRAVDDTGAEHEGVRGGGGGEPEGELRVLVLAAGCPGGQADPGDRQHAVGGGVGEGRYSRPVRPGLAHHASHKEQASMIRRYIIWRNNHAYDERLGGAAGWGLCRGLLVCWLV